MTVRLISGRERDHVTITINENTLRLSDRDAADLGQQLADLFGLRGTYDLEEEE